MYQRNTMTFYFKQIWGNIVLCFKFKERAFSLVVLDDQLNLIRANHMLRNIICLSHSVMFQHAHSLFCD